MQGPVDRKIQTLTTHIYSVAKKRFGLEETMVPRDPPKPNRRQTRIENLRRLLNQLRRRFRDSSPSEQLGLSELRDTLRSQLTSLRKAENTRRKTREKGKKRAHLTANLYKFGKSLLDKERSGLMETPVKEVESYLRETHSDPNREDALDAPNWPCRATTKKMIFTNQHWGNWAISSRRQDLAQRLDRTPYRTKCTRCAHVFSCGYGGPWR